MISNTKSKLPGQYRINLNRKPVAHSRSSTLMKLGCFDAATCWRSLCNKIVFLLSSVVNKLTYQTTSNQWRETSISRAGRSSFEHFQNMSKCSEHVLRILRCLLHLPWAHALPLAVELERYSRELRFWTSYRPVQSRSKDKQRHAATRTWQLHDKDLQHTEISTIENQNISPHSDKHTDMT